MDDIINDPIAQFQRKHIRSLVVLLAVILPTIIPMILWKESFICAFFVNMLRYLITLHSTLCVNSVAHLLGTKPYNKNIHPGENKLLSFFMLGEAFHNYHHSFPWDYKTAELVVLLHFVGIFGITGGCHRLWSHRAYKAKLPLRIILMLFSTLAFQGSIFDWARDHRVHHKWSDTHADPQNSSVGFFFSHIGWLLCKKFPEVKEMRKKLEFRDLLDDPVVSFQKKHIRSMVVLIGIIIPTAIPMILWGETFTNAFCLNFLRHFVTLHVMLAVNSVTHAFGKRPYDRHIRPTESKLVSLLSSGEGFHNYHHAFPWDYKAAELGAFSLNFTTGLIDLFAKIGWAYDLKTPTEEMIRKKVLQNGDGSHNIWGWGDKDQPLKELSQAIEK